MNGPKVQKILKIQNTDSRDFPSQTPDILKFYRYKEALDISLQTLNQITLSGRSFFSCFVLRDNNSIVGVEHDLFHRALIVTICHSNDKWLFLLQLKQLNLRLLDAIRFWHFWSFLLG